MRLRHFFEGMLRKEEIASAFLATVLEHDGDCRRAFLGVVFGASFGDLEDSWQVSVETDRVDVRLESPRAVVLIKNKLNAGAKQQGQLLRYYQAAVRDRPDARIAAVYLAPGGIGLDEVAVVESCAERVTRPGDVVRHLSWEGLKALVPVGTGTHEWFVRSGFEEILAAIERARNTKYELTGGRELIRRTVDDALELLTLRVPDIRLGRFSSSIEEIITYGTPVTMWLQAIFQAETEPPYTPIDLVRDGNLHVTIRTACKLAGKVKKSAPLATEWKRLATVGMLDVPGLGQLALEPSGWFSIAHAIAGSPTEVAAQIAASGQHLLTALRPLLFSR